MVTACIDEKNYVSAGGAISYDWLVEHLIHVNHNEMPFAVFRILAGNQMYNPWFSAGNRRDGQEAFSKKKLAKQRKQEGKKVLSVREENSSQFLYHILA